VSAGNSREYTSRLQRNADVLVSLGEIFT